MKQSLHILIYTRQCLIAFTTLLTLILGSSKLNADPVISNISAIQRTGTKLVDISYDLTAIGWSGVPVSLQVSSDGGTTWTVPVLTVTGAIGSNVVPGTSKSIVWDAGTDCPVRYSKQMRFRIIADDGYAPIPGGSFTMGATSGDIDTLAPSITVTVNSFYMQKKETTKAEWDEVRTWGLANGYTYSPYPGGEGRFLAGQGVAANHPVINVSWWDAVRWCNARSEKEALTPVYKVDSGAVFRNNNTSTLITADWSANGYRLPTEAEWEKAARGGIAGKRFPWGLDTINHSHANYKARQGDFDTSGYDVPTYHPSYYRDPSMPPEYTYTAPVGAFAPNGFGLYDMAGNVAEMCWDSFSGSYYDISNGTTNPRGPDKTGGYFQPVLRGGTFAHDGGTLSCSNRMSGDQNPQGYNILGFRAARSLLVANLDGSETANVTVDVRDAPSFTQQPKSVLVPLGAIGALEAIVAGDPLMNLQWRKESAAIPSAASSTYSIPLVKASDVAAYSLVANNGVGTPQTSDTAYLGVVSPLQGTQVIKVGGGLSLACTAVAPKMPGVTLSYAWKRGVVLLTNGTQPNGAVVSGADKAALAITKLTTADSGSYTCVVTMTTPGNDPVLTAGEALVQVVDAVPVVDAIPLPARLAVSQPVDVFITATNSPTSFSASGLPAGLKLDAKSGRLTGRPTAASKKDLLGAYIPSKLSFKAANPFGPSAAREWNLVIEPFDAQAMGTFHGIVAREGQSNFHMGGQLQLTVASTGVVSGSATLAGQKHSILGALDTSLSADPSANLLIKRSPASLGDLRLQINLNPDENKLTGSITDSRFIMRPGSLELGNPTEQGLVNGTMAEARFSGPRGVVLNSAGNGYIADTGHHVIRFVDAANNVVSTFAGSGSSGSADGTGSAAVFNSPEGLALDASGNLYVADSGNATIRRISPAGVVTTFAGSAGQVGTVNGTGAAARFNQPCALCLDPMGNLYVADRGSHTIRKITTLGVVTTLAGKADTTGHKDASGISALFNSPRGITYDPLLKVLFVADTNNFVIRKVTLAGATTTYAGSPGVAGSNEGLLANARFLAPTGIISLGDGTLVVADTLLVQINANGTCGIISDYVDALNRNDHPVALALNPTDRSLIAAHDTLHAIAGHGANGQSAPSADFVAWRNVWSPTRLVPVANQGLYNAALQTTVPTNDLSIPQGHGYSQLSISKTGGANWTGKAADGSTLTFSTVLAEDDSIPLHVMLYGNTGSLQGVAKINFVTGDLTDHAEHVLDWCKIPQPLVSKDRSYKSGFITTLEMKGGRYTPNDLHGFLGLSGSSAAMRLTFAQSPTETFEQPFTLMDPNGVVVPSNNKSLSLKMDPKTGIFTGSYKEANPALTVNYSGILLNHQTSNEKKGLGHLLKAESSSPTSKIWSAPVALGKSGPQ